MQNINKLISRWGVLLVIVFITAFSCDDIYKKEIISYPSPDIRITSAKSLSFSSAEINIELVRGAGQELVDCAIYIEDITVLSNPIIKHSFVLGEDSVQRFTYRLNADQKYHDYQVYAELNTNLYSYKTPKELIRCSKATFDISVRSSYSYPNSPKEIAGFISQGGRFNIFVEYSPVFTPKTVEVKLNKTLDLTHTLDFKNYWFGDKVETTGSVYLPDSIEPGDYEVYVYIDSSEFKCPRGIRVLSGVWTTIEDDYKGEDLIYYNTFVKDDKLYLIGGRKYATRITYFPVWQYNLIDHNWMRKNNFPALDNTANSMIYPQSLSVNNEAYVVLDNDGTIELWRYDDGADAWSYITEYPGVSYQNVSSFALGDKIYVGGGIKLEAEATREHGAIYANCTDMWAYDVMQRQWVVCSGFPEMGSKYNGNPATTNANGVAYMIGSRNILWQYDSHADVWSELSQFHDYYRTIYHLEEKDGKLFFFGGQDNRTLQLNYNDSWAYDLEQGVWELYAPVPEKCTYGVVFEYDDAIYTGLNYIYSKPRQYTIHRLDY